MTREEAIKFAEYAQIMADGKPDVQEFYKLAESALRKQEHFREVTKKVEPLTLEELREAAETGDPVWLVGMEDGDGWVFIHHVDSCSVRYARIGTSEEWCFRTKSYGVRVWAYRQKPEEGTV